MTRSFFFSSQTFLGITQPPPEILVFQKELQRTEKAMALEHKGFETHRQALQKQLQTEVSIVLYSYRNYASLVCSSYRKLTHIKPAKSDYLSTKNSLPQHCKTAFLM